MAASVIESSEEATTPPPLLTKEGILRMLGLVYSPPFGKL
jgi:hypothetical protein